jgi:hypothetical protein
VFLLTISVKPTYLAVAGRVDRWRRSDPLTPPADIADAGCAAEGST